MGAAFAKMEEKYSSTFLVIAYYTELYQVIRNCWFPTRSLKPSAFEFYFRVAGPSKLQTCTLLLLLPTVHTY